MHSLLGVSFILPLKRRWVPELAKMFLEERIVCLCLSLGDLFVRDDNSDRISPSQASESRLIRMYVTYDEATLIP